ncbi:hypothetical protein D1007_57866 [Hordeum vulgare]|nr:hypothetical protein D1007_57866 [Hordeum vulgare]
MEGEKREDQPADEAAAGLRARLQLDFEDEREVEEVKDSDDLEMMNEVQHDEDDLQILDQMDVAHRKEDVNPSEVVGRTMVGSRKMPKRSPGTVEM